MSTKIKTFPLRLPRSLKEAAERVASEDGTSMNQLVVTALAEKLSAMKTAEIFAERKQRADFQAFDRIMSRKGGVKPAPEDMP
ncbi:MAG: toxin-antitoxin system HicB family antitoxin [Rhizobiales bacterium]|nr:toxin-antitoxin system HicB family antitoxin [Hyphomicrobiales bacterium]OJU38005.1 MAG: hypothetical protein BGN94_10040 [Rhizobiales bacterium 68-8]